jgi:hypothetical protein
MVVSGELINAANNPNLLQKNGTGINIWCFLYGTQNEQQSCMWKSPAMASNLS